MMAEVQTKMREVHNAKIEMYNVGCMMTYIKYRPRTLEEILEANNQTQNS